MKIINFSHFWLKRHYWINYIYSHDRHAINVQNNEIVKKHVKCNKKRDDLYQESHYYFK